VVDILKKAGGKGGLAKEILTQMCENPDAAMETVSAGLRLYEAFKSGNMGCGN
jgi:hypothetical protein